MRESSEGLKQSCMLPYGTAYSWLERGEVFSRHQGLQIYFLPSLFNPYPSTLCTDSTDSLIPRFSNFSIVTLNFET